MSPKQLASALPAWESRIRAMLRASGLPPRRIQQHLHTVSKALLTTLMNPIGQWPLRASVDAKNEFALVTQEEEQSKHYRIDRLLRGGASPGEPGNAHLWIVDYKTSAYAGTIEDELAV